jgi:hypothetical protein
MGDLRSGRQLLEDFAADSRLTIQRMSVLRRGSPALRRLCGAVAGLVGSMEDRVSVAGGLIHQQHQPAAMALRRAEAPPQEADMTAGPRLPTLRSIRRKGKKLSC